jgi:hypothetical protein
MANGAVVRLGSGAGQASGRAHPPKTTDSAAALLPPPFFAAAVGFFTLALLALPLVVSALRVHFYQAHVLAVVHMLTLGWITMVMQGVLYRFVPGIAKRHLPRPRLAALQGMTYLVGVLGLVAHLWLGDWPGATWAAGLLALSVILLCANLWPLLWSAPRRGVAEIGILLGTGSLVAAALLGGLLAADKRWSLLGGTVLTNLAAHAHLAAVGWVGVTACALSFRFLPAFLLPTVEVAAAARRLVVLLAAAVGGLVAALLARSAFTSVAALGVAAALAAHAGLTVRIVASRRMPLDWTARHALASATWCGLAALGGLGLCVTGVQGAFGAHLAGAYGIAGLLGWLSNLVIGVSYKLFPGFVAAARAERGRPAVALAALAVPSWLQPAIFWLFNAGAVLAAAGLVADVGPVLLLGSVMMSGAAVSYGGATARTLAFTVTDPRRPPSALAVLP